MDVTIELIKLIPSILWFVLVLVLIFVFSKPIRDELLPRLSGFEAFGVKVAFIRDEIEKAADKLGVEVSPGDRSLAAKRAKRLARILRGAQILWVDDNPDYIIHERRILRSLGIYVDIARTSAEGLSMLSQTKYNCVISDIERDGIEEEGFQFLEQMRDLHRLGWVIYYEKGALGKDKRVPADALGTAEKPHHLLHLVCDALEREERERS